MARRGKGALLSVLAAVPTATLVTLSTSNGLYLRNQDEFHRDIGVLGPFLAGFVALLAIGSLVARWRHSWPGRLSFWAYQLAAPCTLAYGFLRADVPSLGWVLDEWVGIAALAAVWIAAAAYLASDLDPDLALVPAAVVGGVFLAAEVSLFASRVELPRPSSQARIELAPGDPRRPNLYHLVLDAYDARFFPGTLDAGVQAGLRGFTWFDEAVSLDDATRESLPTVFLGRPLGPEETLPDAERAAFSSRESLLHALSERGYATLAFVPALFDLEGSLFDAVVLHDENRLSAEVGRLDASSFRDLWVATHAPRFLLRGRFAEEWFIVDESGQPMALMPGILSKSAPIASRQSFLKFLEAEAELPATGRYTFIHLLIPHPPYTLDATCRLRGAADVAAPERQFACGTRIVTELVARLRALGRLDGSGVVVHADHGSFETRTPEGWRVHAEGSLESLLLVKPVGAGAPFRIDHRPLSLPAVRGMLLEAAGPASAAHDG